MMWAEPPTHQDIQETAEAIDDYFGTTWKHEVIVYYTLDRTGDALLVLDVYGAPVRPGTKFRLCSLDRAIKDPVEHYAATIQSVINAKEGHYYPPEMGVRL